MIHGGNSLELETTADVSPLETISEVSIVWTFGADWNQGLLADRSAVSTGSNGRTLERLAPRNLTKEPAGTLRGVMLERSPLA